MNLKEFFKPTKEKLKVFAYFILAGIILFFLGLQIVGPNPTYFSYLLTAFIYIVALPLFIINWILFPSFDSIGFYSSTPLVFTTFLVFTTLVLYLLAVLIWVHFLSCLIVAADKKIRPKLKVPSFTIFLLIVFILSLILFALPHDNYGISHSASAAAAEQIAAAYIDTGTKYTTLTVPIYILGSDDIVRESSISLSEGQICVLPGDFNGSSEFISIGGKVLISNKLQRDVKLDVLCGNDRKDIEAAFYRYPDLDKRWLDECESNTSCGNPYSSETCCIVVVRKI